MKTSELKSLLKTVTGRVAPAWPLKNFVAVNPYVGFVDTKFAEAAHQFSERGQVKLTMPIQFYLKQIKAGKITNDDLDAAIDQEGITTTVKQFVDDAKKLSKRPRNNRLALSNLTDIASAVSGKDWNVFMVDRISFWASAYFDDFIAGWSKDRSNQNLYQDWKKEAEISRAEELMGLKGFRSAVKNLPDDHITLTKSVIEQLRLRDEDVEAYLHSLILRVIGWSSYISGIDFNSDLYGEKTSQLEGFLGVILAWEYYFINTSSDKEKIKSIWFKQLYDNESSDELMEEVLETELILQNALDIAGQRELKELINSVEKGTTDSPKASAQMIFCIDVRSEVYRRNLEMVDPSIQTIGFAGFFGFPINYVPLGHNEGKNQCPVLIPSSAIVKESFSENEKLQKIRTSKHQVQKTWKSFKSGAVTSFGFVSPLGLSFLPKILANSFHKSRPVDDPKTDGVAIKNMKERVLDLTMIAMEDQVSMAASALTGMGIKDHLARIVLISGHGSTSLNNPHASGLDCGACGGHSGEINALTAQQILNSSEVRAGLKKIGIVIPEDTLFVACLHNTTTDDISIVNESLVPDSHKDQIQKLKASFEKASSRTRLERSLRFDLDKGSSTNIDQLIKGRSNDWSQIRPEWGLAGCRSLIIAPRRKTQGANLNGTAFLHDYEWSKDNEFKLLETIMTAPMVVTSWINLQYYASTTDNQHFGAGNKTLHNVTAGLGVIEGSGGDLKIGLPMQSVHNGKDFEHIPYRLSVVIDAPIEAINSILKKHENIRNLFDNSWITLHHMNERGMIGQTYKGDMIWSESIKEVNQQKNKSRIKTL